ncbi:hypothetical protein RTG_03180 [Rhodotorula toruloides ATCC 204091]|uniref:Uncharacterized protein n=1 Tax=Rhodotorula toruloides TaxID=5286 RepID=A0A0K3CTZ1_RHOTO|nr:hypothetical protein RTG_03180 [Rhodotorula toruloides ATCC 204091]PRQ70733.1 hypothetical protein AAT19DRAFT_10890 [Rhodotorula toruloides]
MSEPRCLAWVAPELLSPLCRLPNFALSLLCSAASQPLSTRLDLQNNSTRSLSPQPLIRAHFDPLPSSASLGVFRPSSPLHLRHPLALPSLPLSPRSTTAMPRVGPEDENYVPRGPYVWGFPLGDLNFQAFSSKKMFDPRWHLRKERFIAYQVAMLVCLAAECTATYSLDKYEDLQTHIESRFSPAHLYQNDLIDMEISTIVFCVAVACLFGADFFFLLQFPRRVYPKWYQTTKKVLAVVITLGIFACALGSTVRPPSPPSPVFPPTNPRPRLIEQIVIARNSAILSHVSPSVARAATDYYYRPPLRYKDWAVNVAWVVLLWVGWVGCVAA